MTANVIIFKHLVLSGLTASMFVLALFAIKNATSIPKKSEETGWKRSGPSYIELLIFHFVAVLICTAVNNYVQSQMKEASEVGRPHT